MQGTTKSPDLAERAEKAPTGMQLAILRGLQGKHVYGGTVPPGVKAQRRKANRAASRSRRINRRGSK